MAEILGAIGPDWADHRLQGGALTTRTGWTFEATAGGDAPPQTAYWLECDSSGGAYNIGQAGGLTPDDFVWYMMRAFKLRATSLSASDTANILHFGGGVSADLEWLQHTDSNHYNLVVAAGSESDVVGATDIALGDMITVLVEFNGATIKVWLNNDGSGTPEITQTAAFYPSSRQVRLDPPSDGNTPFHDFSGVVWHMSDDEADKRDPTGLEVHMLEGTSSGTDDDYFDKDESSPGDADWDDTDLDGSDQVETTENWNISGAGAQSSNTDDPAESGVVIGAVMRYVNRTNLAAKTVDTYVVVRDVTNTAEVQLPNLGHDSYLGFVTTMPLAPNDVAWSAYDLADVQLGVRTPSGNGASNYWAGIILEVASAALSPAAGGVAPQVHHQRHHNMAL